MADTDPYDLLGVARGTSQKDIRNASRRLAKKLLPDLNLATRRRRESSRICRQLMTFLATRQSAPTSTEAKSTRNAER
jgi:hypothetical protein